jgi:hypothetical protein
MRNLARSIAIFHKIACCASLEATAAIFAITACSTVMFSIVCIFRGNGAHDLLLFCIFIETVQEDYILCDTRSGFRVEKRM